jgi:hypothetical protein
MSSRPGVIRKRIVPASDDVAPGNATAVSPRVPRKRGPRQPDAADFEVKLEMPQSVPILERELRAVEILLGAELRDLLNSNTK